MSDFEEQKLELRKEILQGLGLDPEYFLGDTQYSGTAAALALQDSLVQKRRQRIAAHIQCTHGIRVRFVNAISAKLLRSGERNTRSDSMPDQYDALYEAGCYEAGRCLWCGRGEAVDLYEHVCQVKDQAGKVVFERSNRQRFCGEKCMNNFYLEP